MGCCHLPAIPEAMILHHIDMIDADMYQFESQAEALKPGEATSNLIFGLDQKVYRRHGGSGGREEVRCLFNFRFFFGFYFCIARSECCGFFRIVSGNPR